MRFFLLVAADLSLLGGDRPIENFFGKKWPRNLQTSEYIYMFAVKAKPRRGRMPRRGGRRTSP